MIITPLFYKLDRPIIISQKFALEISNIRKDKNKYLFENLAVELKQYKEDQKEYPPEYRNNMTLKDLLLSKYYEGFFENENLNSETKCLEAISKNILRINATDLSGSMLTLKNQYAINPTCEMSIEEKFIRFFSFLDNHNPFKTKFAEVDIGYNDSEFNFDNEKANIIRSMIWRVVPRALGENNPYRFDTHAHECAYKINKITAFGKLIDSYINSQQDFFVLDFIMDLLSTNDGCGFSQIIKMTSILEFLIAKQDYKSLRNELRNKLPQFLSDEIDNKDLWITVVYDIRSKIAHGDYFELIKKAEKYAEIFMPGFEYDYFEHSKLNWIISNVYVDLSTAVARVIRTMLNCKPLITRIKEA